LFLGPDKRCEKDGVTLDVGKGFSQASLLSFYEEISFSNGAPLSESFFREYFNMERAFTDEFIDYLDIVFQNSTCHCITKNNLILIGKQATTKVTHPLW
jgi:hypothetical protein